MPAMPLNDSSPSKASSASKLTSSKPSSPKALLSSIKPSSPKLTATSSPREDLSKSKLDAEQPLMPCAALETKAGKSELQMKMRKTASMQLNRINRTKQANTSASGEAPAPALKRRNSQHKFASKEHTVICYDWDDTLFPTYWVRHDKQISWRYKLEKQTDTFSKDELKKFKKILDDLQAMVLKILEESMKLGHVVIVTLARPPWVELSCKNFYPLVGKFIEQHKIKVVYAQDLDGKVPENYNKQKFLSGEDAQLFWTQKKQRAIMGEVAKFYAKSGASWKNVISVGDSDFERAATQASLWDYATLEEGVTQMPEVGCAASKLAILSPSRSKGKHVDNNAVSGFVGRHYRRLRVKTIKMFDSPSTEDLVSELNLILKWLPALVAKDTGLDIDFENEEELTAAYTELCAE